MEEWKTRCQKEADKADSLRNHLSRTERELYGILQKKHQILRGAAGTSTISDVGLPVGPFGARGSEADYQMPVAQKFSLSSERVSRKSEKPAVTIICIIIYILLIYIHFI